MTLGTSERLRFPIDGEVRQVIAGLRLIPVIFEGGADQVYPIASPALYEIGRINISRVDQMLIG